MQARSQGISLNRIGGKELKHRSNGGKRQKGEGRRTEEQRQKEKVKREATTLVSLISMGRKSEYPFEKSGWV